MCKLLKKLKNNELINASLYTGFGTFINMISSLIINKIVAVTLGPSGLALITQFQNFIQISTNISSVGIKNGVIKTVSENYDDIAESKKIFSTAFSLSIIGSFCLGLTIIFFANSLSSYLIEDMSYKDVFYLFGSLSILFGINQILQAILNGRKEIKKLVSVNVIRSISALILITYFGWAYGLRGILYALTFSQLVVFLTATYYIYRCNWFSLSFFTGFLYKKYVKKLLAFTVMLVVAEMMLPFIQIQIRKYIIDNLSKIDAGYWDAMWKLSSAYLTFVTSTLSIYYLPKLSYLKSRYDIKREILNAYKIVLPLLSLALLLIFFLKKQIILLLFTEDFLKMQILFGPQLLGDFFKIASWLIAFLMIAKAKIKMFIITQIVFALITYFLTIYLLDHFGIVGAVYAHLIKFIIYFVTVIILLKNYLYVKQK